MSVGLLFSQIDTVYSYNTIQTSVCFSSPLLFLLLLCRLAFAYFSRFFLSLSNASTGSVFPLVALSRLRKCRYAFLFLLLWYGLAFAYLTRFLFLSYQCVDRVSFFLSLQYRVFVSVAMRFFFLLLRYGVAFA